MGRSQGDLAEALLEVHWDIDWNRFPNLSIYGVYLVKQSFPGEHNYHASQAERRNRWSDKSYHVHRPCEHEPLPKPKTAMEIVGICCLDLLREARRHTFKNYDFFFENFIHEYCINIISTLLQTPSVSPIHSQIHDLLFYNYYYYI